MAREKTIRERLICIENKIDCVQVALDNHLTHHRKVFDRYFKLFLVAFGVIGSAITTIILTLIFKS